MHRLPYCREGSPEFPVGMPDALREMIGAEARSDFVAGDIVFASTVFNQIDPLVPLTSFEKPTEFEARLGERGALPPPLSIADNDYRFDFQGGSKIPPQLPGSAKLADYTVAAVGPNLSIEGCIGGGVLVQQGAVLTMSGASITGTRANTFVKNDQLRNGGHGVVAVYPSAIVIEGGLSDSNDGAGCFSVWGGPIVHKKVGRRGYPFLAIVRSLIIILVDCGFRGRMAQGRPD